MNIMVIGVPYALEKANVDVGKAPDKLLEAGLLKRLEAHNPSTILVEMVSIEPSEEPPTTQIAQLQTRIGYEVARARAAGFFPILLGGDCMLSLGAVAGLMNPENTGIIWFDAHGDFNTPETSQTGYLGGMPLAIILGHGHEELRQASKISKPIPERNTVLIGARDLDKAEEHALTASSVRLVRAEHCHSDMNHAFHAIHELNGLEQIYLHFDLDALDTRHAPAVNNPASHGLTPDQVKSSIQHIANLGKLSAFSLTGFNPAIDDGQTLAVALDIIDTVYSTLAK
jgi:arginase